jgi:hypothetical protein
MRGKSNSHGAINFAVSITLFTVFALALMLVLLTGASAFRSISEESQARFEERTPLLFFGNRLRDADSVRIAAGGESGEIPMLVIEEEFADVFLYLYGGYIREHFCFDRVIPTSRLDSGIELFPAQSLEFEAASENLLSVSVNGRAVLSNVEVRHEEH